MPPLTATPSIAHITVGQYKPVDFLPSQQHEPYDEHIDGPKVTPSSDSSNYPEPAPTPSHRLDVKTHVFKKELQEYVPTQSEDRHRIETIIYVELSIVRQDDGSLAKTYDYICFPKEVLNTLPDKVMPPDVVASKRILNVDINLKCPSNHWRIEKEACARCVRRMSAKLEQDEIRIMHILPELYRTESGDTLIHFRNGVANIQLKVNCYCGHKMEKEGFVICFDPQSDTSIAAHGTSPLMFYHQNKNRTAARALVAAAKAQAKAEKLRQQQEARDKVRSGVKSVSGKAKRTPRSNSRPGHSEQDSSNHFGHHILSPPNSSLNSPVEFSASPELCERSDVPFLAQTDPMSSLFPELSSPPRTDAPQAQQQAMISHMTPDRGSTRGGTLVTIHGSDFNVGEMMYICFGETFVPVIPHHSQMVECYTPPRSKAETVAVFALHSTVPTNIPSQCTFTYVDDNEKELIKLALHRIMAISAHMDGPLESVMNRANELLMWSDILGAPGNLDDSSTLRSSFSSLEAMIMESLKVLDTPGARNTESLSISNNTNHTMLHLSVVSKYRMLTKDLILRGIDVRVKDKNGHTAEGLARFFNDRSMADIFDSTVTMVNRSDNSDSGPCDKSRTLNMNNDKGGDKQQMTATIRQIKSVKSSDSRRLSLTVTTAKTVTLAQRDDLQMDYERIGLDQNSNAGSDSRDDMVTDQVQQKIRRRDNTTIPMQLEEQRPVREQKEHSVDSDTGMGDTFDSHLERRSNMHAMDWTNVQNVANVSQRTTIRISGQNHDRLLMDQQGVNAQLTTPMAGGRVVVVRRCNNNNGGSVDLAEQAAVQSSRYDDESEPVFLGGLPVLRGTDPRSNDKNDA